MGEWVLVGLNTGYEERTVEVTIPAMLADKVELEAHFGHPFTRQGNRVKLTLPACEFEILTQK